MQIDAGFATTTEVPELIACAETLGYRRAWCYNSPAVYADPWSMAVLAARATERIELGIMVIPELRHVVDAASALATLATVADRPISVGIGAGYASRVLLGQRPVPWVQVEAFISRLRRLLAGEEIELDGSAVKLLQGPDSQVELPAAVRFIVAVHGPRSKAVAARLGDGLITAVPSRDADAGTGEIISPVTGTVLDEGEAPGSARAIEAAGPAAAFLLHLGDVGPLAGSDESAGFQRAIEEIPASRRHLEVHAAHLVGMTELDRRFMTARVISAATDTGTASQMRRRLDELEAQGVTSVIYVPTGPDRERELRAMAEVAGIG